MDTAKIVEAMVDTALRASGIGQTAMQFFGAKNADDLLAAILTSAIEHKKTEGEQ